MQRWLIVLLLLMLALVLALSVAQAQAPLELEVRGVDRPNVTDIIVDLLVRDPQTGLDLPDVTADQIVVVQDGQAQPELVVDLVPVATSAVSPSIPFGDGVLQSRGATIGLVVDLSTAIGSDGQTDYVLAMRQLARVWLEAGRDQTDETIGLFIPVSRAAETLQPADLTGFSADRNAVINALELAQPRSGATDLAGAIQTAFVETDRYATAHGTNSFVVVLSDGGGLHSDDLARLNIPPSTKLLSFGVAPQVLLDQRSELLRQLSVRSGGMYVPAPAPADMLAVYSKYVQPVQRIGYRVRYTPPLLTANQRHTVQLQINRAGQTSYSSVVIIPPLHIPAVPLRSLNGAARIYLLQAACCACVIALLGTGLIGRFFGERIPSVGSETRL